MKKCLSEMHQFELADPVEYGMNKIITFYINQGRGVIFFSLKFFKNE